MRHVRERRGPALLRLTVPRLEGHSFQDTQTYKSAEVIAAAVDGMTLANAQRLVQERQRTPLRDLASPSTAGYFPVTMTRPLPEVLSVSSNFFIIQGRLRLEERVLEERTLVERRQLEVNVRSRERVNLREGT